MMRWREWLRWSWFGEAVKFVSSEMQISRSSAKELVVSYRDLWPEEFSERPFTLAVWICSFAERQRVGAGWMQAAATSLDNAQGSAARRCGHSRMSCLLSQAAGRGLPGKQAFEFALSMLDTRPGRTVRDKPAA
jgi:hypothetical protein